MQKYILVSNMLLEYSHAKKKLLCQRNKFSNGERIPLLHDALQQCLDNELRVIIDIKETRTDVVQVVLDAYKKYPKLFQRGFVTSFNPIILYMVCAVGQLIINISKANVKIYFFANAYRSGRKSHVSWQVSAGGRIISREHRTLA